MNDQQQAAINVGGSWWTSGAGFALSAWSWIAEGMAPLAALLAVLTIILTVIKIAQEIRAWRRSDDERTVIKQIAARLARRSGFTDLDSKP